MLTDSSKTKKVRTNLHNEMMLLMDILYSTIVKWMSTSVLLMVRYRSTETGIWVQEVSRRCDITEIPQILTSVY